MLSLLLAKQADEEGDEEAVRVGLALSQAEAAGLGGAQ